MIRLLWAAPLLLAASVAQADDREFVDTAKAYLTRNFNDPDSAKYRDLYIGTDADGKPVLCGEVNARNGRGGMSGFQAFFSKPGEDAWWAGQPREFMERSRGSLNPDYASREGQKCVRPGKPAT